MKIGEIFESEVVDLSSSGQGVIRHPSGITCFASGVWLGERATFRILKAKKRFANAELVALIKADPRRQIPPCSYSGNDAQSCGACPWMFIEYTAQLEAKDRRVNSAIARIDKVWAERTESIVSSPMALSYRNRVQFKSDGKRLGFLAAASHRLIDVETCSTITDDLNTKLRHLRKTLPNKDWKPSKSYEWVTIDVDELTPADQASINKRLPFKQANDQQNLLMQNWLKERVQDIIQSNQALADCGRFKLVELFCGSGNFTSILAGLEPLEVIAAECSETAIAELNSNNWGTVEAHCVDLFDEAVFRSFMKKCKSADILVLDPPRDGLKVKSGLFSKSVAPEHVIYISCDISTFTRDLDEFKHNGYELISLQPLDLFPQTPHVELLAYIRRNSKNSKYKDVLRS